MELYFILLGAGILSGILTIYLVLQAVSSSFHWSIPPFACMKYLVRWRIRWRSRVLLQLPYYWWSSTLRSLPHINSSNETNIRQKISFPDCLLDRDRCSNRDFFIALYITYLFKMGICSLFINDNSGLSPRQLKSTAISANFYTCLKRQRTASGWHIHRWYCSCTSVLAEVWWPFLYFAVVA